MKLTRDLESKIVGVITAPQPGTKWKTRDLHILDQASGKNVEIATVRAQVKVTDELGEGKWEESRVLVIKNQHTGAVKVVEYNHFEGDMLYDALCGIVEKYEF